MKFYTLNFPVREKRGKFFKTLLIMKMAIFIICAAFLQVSASTGFAQKVTLNEKDASLEKVFNDIKKQTGVIFFYKADALRGTSKVNINVKDATLQEALDQCLKDQPLIYTIAGNTIGVKKKEENLIDKAKAFYAQVTVTGKVTDETGQQLPGVTVKIKDSDLATATDSKGSYTITVPDNNTILVFSFIGYETQELAAKYIPSGSAIIFKAVATNLKEVVVNKGYYNEKRELSTGDVSVVSAKEIGQQPVSDPIMALEGRVPGLQISQASGMPGSALIVQLRGQNSIANGNAPLYIVDGVPFTSTTLTSSDIGGGAVGIPYNGGPVGLGLSPFNSLSPTDIESIEVLKDADATAIYGSRGANGVILITTKKGKPGSTKFDIDVNSGTGEVSRFIPMLNSQQYLAMRNEAFKNGGNTPGASDYDLNGLWDNTRYTDWQKMLIGGTAKYTNAQAEISGGNLNTQFLIGGAYNRQTTVFPGNFFDQKGSLHVSLNH